MRNKELRIKNIIYSLIHNSYFFLLARSPIRNESGREAFSLPPCVATGIGLYHERGGIMNLELRMKE